MASLAKTMAWQEQLRSRGRNEVARELHEQWKDSASSEALVKWNSLATQLGKLLRQGDKTGWWARRPTLQRLLGQLLGVDPTEIFGGPREPNRIIAFPEFPRLPPLELGEDPCWLGPSGSLLDEVMHRVTATGKARSHTWLTALPGAGKSLVVRILASRHPGGIISSTVRRLAEVPAPSIDVPMVIEAEEAPSDECIDRLLFLENHPSPVVVLSAFPMPAELEPSGSDEGLVWLERNGDPVPGWRLRLLQWIDARLERMAGDTKLEVKAVCQWLAEHDPDETMVATPGDMLALCADFDAHGGLEDVSPWHRARRWLASVGLGMLPADAPATWRKRNAEPVYQHLVVRELHHRPKRYGELDPRDWEALLPEGAPENRRRAPSAVDYLLAAGLFRWSQKGVAPYPRWVARSFSMEDIRIALVKSTALGWGALAADESRSEIIDAVLDGLPEEIVRRLLLTITDRGEPANLVELAELESILAAVGRRLDVGSFKLRSNDERVIQDLLGYQIDKLVEFMPGSMVHRPYTRREHYEWFATGWSLSLRVPRPDRVDIGRHPWQFPGWEDVLDLETVPHGFPLSYPDPPHAKPGVRRLIRSSAKLLSKLGPGSLASLPRLMLPAALLDEKLHDRLEPSNLFQIRGTWEEGVFAAKLSQLSKRRLRTMANLAWRLAGVETTRSGRDSVVSRLRKVTGELRLAGPRLLQATDPAVISETAHEHGTHLSGEQNPRELLALTTEQLQAALRAWHQRSASDRPRHIEARDLRPLFELEDVDVAVELAQASDAGEACEFAGVVWRLDAPRALQESRHALEGELPAAAGWFHMAPRERFVALVDMLDETGLRPGWLRNWVEKRVLDGGEAAERMYALGSELDQQAASQGE